MKQKIKLENIIQYIKLRKRLAFIVLGGLVLLIAVVGFTVFYFANKNSSTILANDDSGVNNASVVTVGEGETLIAGNTTSNNSWPGEIISLNNLQVQPARDGTISEWYVHIGERVYAGQTIGKLSRPPQMPDAIMSLSEKQQMMSEAETSVVALRTFTAKRISELKQLRMDTESSNQQKLNLLKTDSSEIGGSTTSLISSKIKMAQAILKGSLSKAFPVITNQTNLFLLGPNFGIQYIQQGFGIINSNLRGSLPEVMSKAFSDSQSTNVVPEKSGLLYFDTTIKLIGASAADGEVLTTEGLNSLRDMLVADQSEFISALGEIKSMELEGVNTQRESIDTLAEIDEKMADLQKDLSMAEGDLVAKKTAYETMKGSINGGYSITAPTSGVVSNIMKKPGDFVSPGMAMASVTANDRGGMLVRMSIPNNIQKPKVGDTLLVVRPGFETDARKAQLVGVGVSLDDNGSYMADATFAETNDWSIGASVRILQPASSSALLIKYTSVVFDNNGKPSVWAVSEADRVFYKKITIGRTLGDSIEVYTGLQNGDRYINNPTPDIKEDMFVSDIIKTPTPVKSSGNGGMEM